MGAKSSSSASAAHDVCVTTAVCAEVAAGGGGAEALVAGVGVLLERQPPRVIAVTIRRIDAALTRSASRQGLGIVLMESSSSSRWGRASGCWAHHATARV